MPEFVGRSRHELWLSAIRKNAARLGGTAWRSGCYAPRSILQVQPAWPFPFSPTFQNGLRRPVFAPENLSNWEGFSSAAHKPRPGPLRAAMLSASPGVLEVQVQTPCEVKKCVFLKDGADDDHRMRSHAVNQLIASGALKIQPCGHQRRHPSIMCEVFITSFTSTTRFGPIASLETARSAVLESPFIDVQSLDPGLDGTWCSPFGKPQLIN